MKDSKKDKDETKTARVVLFELAFVKHHGEIVQPKYEAELRGPGDQRTVVGRLERGNFETEVGMVDCWFYVGPLGEFKRRNLRDAKDKVAAQLFDHCSIWLASIRTDSNEQSTAKPIAVVKGGK